MTADVNPKPAPEASSSPGHFDCHHDSRIILTDGAVAQLGERIPRTDEVRGSNPLGSTSLIATMSLALLPESVDSLHFPTRWLLCVGALPLVPGCGGAPESARCGDIVDLIAQVKANGPVLSSGRSTAQSSL
jgi:hypothetical protein